MSVNYNPIEGDIKAVGNRVLVSDMHFGEQTTKSGIIITNDNGSTRGIYPRWGKVYRKGPQNKDPYSDGDWILVEHGRWTRSIKLENGSEEIELRMVESESILAWTDQKPDDAMLGNEYGDGDSASYDPSTFVNAQY